MLFGGGNTSVKFVQSSAVMKSILSGLLLNMFCGKSGENTAIGQRANRKY